MVQETARMRWRRVESFMVVDGGVRVGLGYGYIYIYMEGEEREVVEAMAIRSMETLWEYGIGRSEE